MDQTNAEKESMYKTHGSSRIKRGKTIQQNPNEKKKKNSKEGRYSEREREKRKKESQRQTDRGRERERETKRGTHTKVGKGEESQSLWISQTEPTEDEGTKNTREEEEEEEEKATSIAEISSDVSLRSTQRNVVNPCVDTLEFVFIQTTHVLQRKSHGFKKDQKPGILLHVVLSFHCFYCVFSPPLFDFCFQTITTISKMAVTQV